MKEYTFITRDGFIIKIEAESYVEACELYRDMCGEG